MNTNNNDLENIKIRMIEMHKHRIELRRSLLTSSYWSNKKIYKFLFWKGGEEEMRNKKLAVFGAGLSVVAVALVLTVVFMSESAKTAYAAQVAQKSYQAVSTLTPEGLAALKQKLPMDPSELLQEAKSANDLQTLTYDEFVNLYPQVKMGFSTRGPVISNNPQEMPLLPPDAQIVDMQQFKFLQFTDKNGGKVVVGIDKDDLPVFAYTQRKDGSTMGVMKSAGTEDGPVSGFVSVGAHAVGGGEALPPDVKGGGFGFSTSDGKTIDVNGHTYAVPEGESGPSTVKVDGDNVYYNGTKLIPQE